MLAISLANLNATSAFSLANLTARARTLLNPGVIVSDGGMPQTAIVCRDAFDEQKIELTRSLDILLGELTQLLGNIKGLILRHDILLNKLEDPALPGKCGRHFMRQGLNSPAARTDHGRKL